MFKKNSPSKLLGRMTGKIVANAVALPNKTASTTTSILEEFKEGYKSTNSLKVKVEN